MAFEWSHHGAKGPDTWTRIYPLCKSAGERQSPIDIVPTAVKVVNPCNQIIYKYTPQNVPEITNSGHGWKIPAISEGSEVYGGPLEGKYIIHDIHAHWREEDDQGSEHAVNGKRFAAELHMVHRKEGLKKIKETFPYPDGVAVLGSFIKLGKKHEEIEKIVAELPKIEFRGDTVKFSAPLYPGNLLPNNQHCYYNYRGSLTTPPCTECVTWIMFKECIEISEDQLHAFRKLKMYERGQEPPCDIRDHCVLCNARPIAPTGNREVTQYIQ